MFRIWIIANFFNCKFFLKIRNVYSDIERERERSLSFNCLKLPKGESEIDARIDR